MGFFNTSSKPTETKVFTPQSKIEYGSGLIDQLEKGTESDFTRSQLTEIALEKEVSKRLDILSKESNEHFDKTLASALLTKDDNENVSSKKLNDKIIKLNKELKERESKFFKLSDDVLKSKKSIVSCLKQNQDRPLNCWDEVKNFEKLVNELA